VCVSGGGFPAFGPAKPVVTPFGQGMAGPMVPNNPFLVSLPFISIFIHSGNRNSWSAKIKQ